MELVDFHSPETDAAAPTRLSARAAPLEKKKQFAETRYGTAISWDPDTARYGVQLDSTDVSLGTICVAVKPANLRASSS